MSEPIDLHPFGLAPIDLGPEGFHTIGLDRIDLESLALGPNGCGPETFLFPVDSGGIVDLEYSTTFQNEHSYKVFDQFGVLLHEKTSSANNGNGPESTYGIQLCDSPSLIVEKEDELFFS